MKIILLKDVKGLGKEGDLVTAKDGYSRNYIIPNKLGLEATPENLENWKQMKAEQLEQEKENIAEANKTKENIEKIEVVLKVKAGENGRLFGAITSSDIAKQLKKDHSISVDRKKIELKENIKQMGEYKLPVKIYKDITADLNVKIVTE